MDYSEKWGTSVEEAVRLALIDLKCTEDEVTVTVLEEPSKGFFGIGSKLAKVRVEKKLIVKPAAVEAVKAKPEEKKPERPERVEWKEEKREESRPERRERPQREPREPREKSVPRTESKLSLRVRPDDLTEVMDHAALTFLREVAEKMGLTISIRAFVDEENIFIDIEGKDSGTIIGKRGQTLDAIQYLTSLVVNKNSEKYVRVVIDAENYRTKRERTLEQLANRLADKVKRSGKSVRLEPMNPYERKVIHATLQSRPEVTTRSEGEEPYRRVIIEKNK